MRKIKRGLVKYLRGVFDILDKGAREGHTKKVVLCKDLKKGCQTCTFIGKKSISGKGKSKGKLW